MDRIERTKTDCLAFGSAFCEYAGSDGCDDCVVAQSKDDDVPDMIESWKITSHFFPDGIDEFHNQMSCQLSKDEQRPADCYVILDLAHPEPKHMKGMFFGFGKKVRSPIGSMIQLPIPASKVARNFFRLREIYKWLTIAVCTGIGILAAALIPDSGDTDGMIWILDVGIIAIGVAGGVLLSRMFHNIYTKNHENKFHMDLREIDIVKKLFDKGWFAFQSDKNDVPLMLFSSKKPRPRAVFKADIPADVTEESPGVV